jgi:hypothetical protein
MIRAVATKQSLPKIIFLCFLCELYGEWLSFFLGIRISFGITHGFWNGDKRGLREVKKKQLIFTWKIL